MTVKKMLKWIGIILIAVVLLFFVVIVVVRIYNYCKYRIASPNGIQESTYLEVNGVQHYVQIRGKDKNNPVILFLHGGPASPMGYVSPYYQSDLEDEYTFINYDQRGCGRTYYANDGGAQNLSIEQLEQDLDVIVDYALKWFEQKQVIIMGHSWGTILGTLYIQDHPEKVSSYIGVSQIVDMFSGKVSIAEKAQSLAEGQNEEDAVLLDKLIHRMKATDLYEKINWNDLSKMVGLSAKYLSVEGECSSLKQMWLGVTSPYMNFTDMRWFIQQMNMNEFFEMEKPLMEYAFFDFNLETLSHDYEVPVYYIAGEGDYATPQDEVERYCHSISAPNKGFYLLENVGHSMFIDNPSEFSRTAREILANESFS